MATKSIPLNEATKVAVDLLSFDTINPRYSGEHLKKDNDIIAHLNETADLQELLQSIAANGYIDIEPLVVMQSSANDYLVLEGNRRLAAIRLLSDPKLAKTCAITVPEIDASARATLKEITVYRVKTRDDARNFIGFKHINGPYRWDSIAKGRFAADWYRAEMKNGVTLRSIARRMGDRHDTIQRMVAGIYVLDQARAEKLFNSDDRYPGRPFAFSHLYTALTRPGYRAFLGLPEEWRAADPEPNPVPKKNLESLKRLLIWLYGSQEDEIRPIVVSQNPHVKQLGEILGKPKARAILISTNNLAAAYAEVDTQGLQFERSLIEAHQSAGNALKNVTGFDGADVTLVQVASELAETSKVLVTVMTDASKKVATKK
jgi:hypothetical protein